MQLIASGAPALPAAALQPPRGPAWLAYPPGAAHDWSKDTLSDCGAGAGKLAAKEVLTDRSIWISDVVQGVTNDILGLDCDFSAPPGTWGAVVDEHPRSNPLPPAWSRTTASGFDVLRRFRLGWDSVSVDVCRYRFTRSRRGSFGYSGDASLRVGYDNNWFTDTVNDVAGEPGDQFNTEVPRLGKNSGDAFLRTAIGVTFE